MSWTNVRQAKRSNASNVKEAYNEWSQKLRTSNCKLCPLSEGRRTIVAGRGNPETDVVFIGDAPDEKADEIGQAFVGNTGVVLHKQLAEISIDTRTTTLLTTVVRCLPPMDRTPKPAEIKACAPYLEEQLNIVKPKIVVLFGAIAVKGFTGRALPLQGFAGKIFDASEFPEVKERYPFLKAVMVAYHPSFLLRDPTKTPEALKGWQTLRRWLEEHKNG